MLQNYLKIAWRNLRNQIEYTAINIIGLAVGLAACLLIGLYVLDELSYDEFHENKEQTYRVLREFDIPDLQGTIGTTPSALAPALEENLVGVQQAVRILTGGPLGSPIVEYENNKFVESSFITAEAGFFDLFSFPVIHGEASLERPATILVSEKMATKYFADENPIGKTLIISGEEREVTGIIANVPANAHLQFDFVASLDKPELNWGRNNYATYLLVEQDYSKEALTQQIADIIQTNTDPENERAGNSFIPHLQPVTGIHLGQGVDVEIGSQGNILYVYLFSGLAVFIILLACINFMNLATARSAERAREVGMRKTLGASRVQIAIQFLGESVMIAFLSLIFALILCQLSLPFLNDLAGKSLLMDTLYGGPQIIAIVMFTMLIGLAAGFYPAVILSRFQLSKAVKGLTRGGSGSQLRKGLVVFQFAISITLLAGTGIVYQQLQFMKSAGLGFNEENVLLIEQANFLGQQTDTFKNQLETITGIGDVSSGFSMPGTFLINSYWQPSGPDAEAQNINYSFVDFNYTQTLEMEIVAGRSFSDEYSTDSTAAILNKAAVNDYGWTPEEAIGKQLSQGQRAFTIVGVVKDFHYRALHTEIYPLALFGPQRTPQFVAARIAPENLLGTLEAVQGTWEEFSELPLKYTFLADDLAAQYRAEDKLAKVFGVFAMLAILIGCLGLLGLAAFMAQRRTKEIGIRKVLGATVTNIVGLLSKDFLKLVALGFIIAVPIAFYAMNQWLADFAYRIDIGPGIFLLAGGLALLIALATVSWQSIRAALANPVDSLRSE